MIKTPLGKKALSVILAFAILISSLTCYSLTVFAQNTVSDLKDKIADYEEKIDAAQEKLDSLKGDINEVQAYIEELDRQIAMYQSQIDAYQAQIDEYQAQIDEYEAENEKLRKKIFILNAKIDEYNSQIADMNEEIEGKYTELKELIRTNFINGETSAVEVLLTSDDFSDYLTKVQFVSSLADYEQDIIDDINNEIDKIDKTVAKIDAQKVEIEEYQKTIDAQIAEIETLQDAVEANQVQVQANQNVIQAKVNENSNYLASLNDQSDAYKKKIAEYEAAIKKFDQEIEALIRAQASSGSGTLANSSGLICPLQYSGVYVSSGFYRNSDGSYHGALDLCVSGGTYGLSISAAESGTVITASYHWSYGNYIIIDHGNGLSTLYAHCSSLVAGSGQSVSKGQTIAYVGSTGNVTGPHLHFEVRVNGSRVNPAGYISV